MANGKGRLPVRLNLRPGENGTKKLVEKYGDKLICVRYRYDETQGMRYKTVELIEESGPWEPEITRTKEAVIPAPTDRFGVRIGYEESTFRDKVKQIGGIWRPQQRLWELTYSQIEALNLKERVVTGESI